MSKRPTRPQGVLDGVIVNYPSALPSPTWLRDKLLWAERLGSIWPSEYPRSNSDDEEAVLEMLWRLQSEGIFVPCRVDHDRLNADLGRLAERVSVSSDERRDWLRGNGFPLREFDPDRMNGSRKEELEHFFRDGDFFYGSKVGYGLQRALIDEGLADETPGGGLRVKSKGTAATLMSLLANYAQPEGTCEAKGAAEPVVLDADSTLSLVNATAPSRTNWVPAVFLTVPVIRSVNDDVPLEKFVEFRTSSRGERLRGNYIASVSRLLDNTEKCLADDPEHLASVVAVMREDVYSAGQELTRAGSGWRIARNVMSAVALVVPVATGMSDPGAWAGFAANAGAAAAGVGATRVGTTHAAAYSRALHKGRLVVA